LIETQSLITTFVRLSDAPEQEGETKSTINHLAYSKVGRHF